jgi:hypothetical protein
MGLQKFLRPGKSLLGTSRVILDLEFIDLRAKKIYFDVLKKKI